MLMMVVTTVMVEVVLLLLMVVWIIMLEVIAMAGDILQTRPFGITRAKCVAMGNYFDKVIP